MDSDLIIVGGGFSSSLFEAKLASSGASVLVLKVGGSDRNPMISMPADFIKLLGAEKLMWFHELT